MKLINVSAVCSKGKVRKENQDMIYIQGLEENGDARSVNICKTFELTGETDYTDDDIFILCSDGLTDMIDEEKILDISLKNGINRLAEKLFDEAMNSGGRDNISVVAFSVINNQEGNIEY